MSDQSLTRINLITKEIVDSAIKLHQHLGPGLLESVYQHCLAHELTKRGFQVQKQVALPVEYEGEILEAGYRIDILVNGLVVIEVKAVEAIHPIHEAQLLAYLRLSERRVGILLNFNVLAMKQGIKRMIV